MHCATCESYHDILKLRALVITKWGLFVKGIRYCFRWVFEKLPNSFFYQKGIYFFCLSNDSIPRLDGVTMSGINGLGTMGRFYARLCCITVHCIPCTMYRFIIVIT